jgi:hypothetical protein
MSQFLGKVRELRSDLSEWLVHFTKGTRDQASTALSKILSESCLRSSPSSRVICFSEAPLKEWNKLFGLCDAYPVPRFSPYGIAVKKDWLFSKGGRPAIYGPESEYHEFPISQRYRYVTYQPGCDFTWLREWRINTDELRVEPISSLVVVPDQEAALGLTCEPEVEYEYEGPDESSMSGFIKHEWYSLLLDQIATASIHQDTVIAKCMQEQELENNGDS